MNMTSRTICRSRDTGDTVTKAKKGPARLHEGSNVSKKQPEASGVSTSRSEAQKRRHRRESIDICPACGGAGTVVARNVHTRAKQGDTANYRASLKPGGRAMGDRNQGAKPNLTLAEMRARDADEKEDLVRTPASHLSETKLAVTRDLPPPPASEDFEPERLRKLEEEAARSHRNMSPANRLAKSHRT